MTPEERREILALVASGKIGADEASALLQGNGPAKAPPVEQVIPVEEESAEPVEKAGDVTAGEAVAASRRVRQLHIHVNDLKSGSRRVSVNVPLGFLRAGLALGESVAPQMRRLNWNEITTALLDEQGGMIVEVNDEEDGKHVQIFVD
jgi:hypothetical protein